MDGDGGSGMRNYWPFYKGNDSHLRQDINLRQDIERDNTKHFFPGYFHHPECSTPQPQSPMDLPPSSWMTPRGETKFLNYVLSASHHNHANYGVMSPNPIASHIMQPPDPPPEDEKPLLPKEEGKKKRSQAQPTKPPKPKKPKKAAVPKDEPTDSSASQENMGKSSSRLVINGIDLDISRIPTPVCSCTGTGQQCYKWGIGGWQSACCTTNTSQYPLPMSTKRRGARIAGRKMSQGAFKKVLERLAGEGYNLSNPIDLKQYWAKHGTNKFVTIR